MKKQEILNLIILVLLCVMVLQDFVRHSWSKPPSTTCIYKEYDACAHCTAKESKNWQQAIKNVRADLTVCIDLLEAAKERENAK